MQKWILICVLFYFINACKQNNNNNNNKDHQVIKDKLDVPYVEAIYPKNDSIPENVLKFYIQFSQPMREGAAGSQGIYRSGRIQPERHTRESLR